MDTRRNRSEAQDAAFSDPRRARRGYIADVRSAPISRRGFSLGAAAAVGLSLTSSRAAEPPKVNIYNWDDYVGETTYQDFRRETGITARPDLFADNDELFARLREGNPGYDVIFPTSDFLERMIAADMVERINHDRIPNFNNLSTRFRDPTFDPQCAHHIPYMWGTAILGYRKSAVDAPPDSWKWLFEEEKYARRIALLSDSTSTMAHAMKYLGWSANDASPKRLAQAAELLIEQKPRIKAFAADNGQDLLASREVDLCLEWSGDILQVMDEDDDLNGIVPNEGALMWVDVMAIPKNAPHPENAHAFINYVLDARVGASIAEYINYATPNEAAKKFLPDEYLNNPTIFPDQKTLDRCETQVYLGEEFIRVIDELWTRIQAA